MGKRKTHAKRSLGSLPKGLPIRGSSSFGKDSVNPFEITHKSKRPKFEVHNKGNSNTSASRNKNRPSALALALQKRQLAVRNAMQQSKKANVFTDRRIGEYDTQMTPDEQKLARLVRERASRSKKLSKYSLDDDNNRNDVLTHRGRSLEDVNVASDVLLSDDDDDDKGNLDASDTMLHFGGGILDKDKRKAAIQASPYGPSEILTLLKTSGNGNVSDQYGNVSRKLELEDLIMKRKLIKAEKLKSKEEQLSTFEQLDDTFQELASMLQFRDKGKEARERASERRAAAMADNEGVDDLDEWDKQMKQFMHGTQRKAKATDRTKTPEEIAKEEFDRLHELERRRIARMNGTAGSDDLDDVEISDDDNEYKSKIKSTKKSGIGVKSNQPEALDNDSDNDDEHDDGITTKFTADGLVRIDRDGNFLGKVGEAQEASPAPSESRSTVDDDDRVELTVGMKVSVCYHANEQFVEDEQDLAWYNAVIAQINDDGTYNVDYDDGDYEDDVERHNIRVLERHSLDELSAEARLQGSDIVLKKKRQKAKELASAEIPYVFEVPTTLDAFHDLISKYATTGADVSLIVQRIQAGNSVRLDRRNVEKMQNFYDVLMRRFIAVGDAIHTSGNGGVELGRYKQLDELTRIMYDMAQEAPDCVASVWSRRLGYFHKAHSKRLRDAELVCQSRTNDNNDNNEPNHSTIWPSTGVVLLLRIVGHIFPVTDMKHPIVTPTILFLSQVLCTTPIRCKSDLVTAVMCCGILIEFTNESKRVSPEVFGFLASVIRLFASKRYSPLRYSLSTVGDASYDDFCLSLRKDTSDYVDDTNEDDNKPPQLSLENEIISNSTRTSASILFAALHLVELSARNLGGFLASSEKEAFAEITEAVLSLEPKSKLNPLPKIIQVKVASVASTLDEVCKFDAPRCPLQRRASSSQRGATIQTLAPRMENPERYSFSKDKGKSATQSAADRARREYKREHKAVARELRLDGQFIETERRADYQKKTDSARAKRQRAFAWLESEQSAMNQQVRLGGGLLQGGGTGAAKLKAKTGKLGIKKGGKF